MDAILTNIIKAPHKRRDKGRACLGGKQCLHGGKTKCHIDHGACIAEVFTHFKACLGKGDFNGDVISDFSELFAFFHHRIKISRGDLRTDGAITDLADFFDEGYELFAQKIS